MCRIWRPGQPPGHQPKSGACPVIERAAPPGSWVVYRPTANKKVVHVREVDARRTGVVVRVQVFDAASGEFLREENP